MPDLAINHLNLQVQNGSGHEHRVGAIARQAVETLANRLNDDPRGRTRWPSGLDLDSLSVPAIRLNLGTLTDRAAADAIANAIVEALRHTREETSSWRL